MKICVIGDIDGNLDEGMKNVANNIIIQLEKKYDVLVLNPKNVIKHKFWRDMKNFEPEIIHYIAGPTTLSFIIVSIAKRVCGSPFTIISMIHPKYLIYSLIKLLKPNLLLSQSYTTEEICKKLKCEFEFLPNGVNLESFKPVYSEKKIELRNKYGIPSDKFVILHVGNFRKGRNLEALIPLKTDKTEIIVVGSTTISDNGDMKKKLISHDFKIIDYYIPKIQELYHVSDCYVFPTLNTDNCIDIPLSILEAMSCNLPVVSTNFGGLNRLFKDGKGFYLIKNEEELINAINNLQKKGIKSENRIKVSEYSWESIANKLIKIYLDMQKR